MVYSVSMVSGRGAKIVVARNKNIPRRAPLVGDWYFFYGVILVAIVFWSLRILYWSTTEENPFSDMLDYLNIAIRIYNDWDFSHSAFFKSHHVPTLPLLIAISFWIFGVGSQLGWQIWQASILFFGLFFVAYELRKATNSNWLALGFMLSVAVGKWSIFWSLKYATEGLSEGLLYFVLGLSLFCFRKGGKFGWFINGAVNAALVLTRPNFIGIFVALIGILFVTSFPLVNRVMLIKRLLLCLFGFFLIWAPWVGRGYLLYGGFLPFSTHSGASFFWELGQVSVVLDSGKVIEFDSEALEAEAAQRFANDYEAHAYNQKLVKTWVAQNTGMYVALFFRRLWNMVVDDDVGGLSKVSRHRLFPGALNELLIDKSVFFVISGLLGLIGFIVFYRPLILFLVFALMPAFIAALIIGYGRMLEPVLGLILFGNFFWFKIGMGPVRTWYLKIIKGNFRFCLPEKWANYWWKM